MKHLNLTTARINTRLFVRAGLPGGTAGCSWNFARVRPRPGIDRDADLENPIA